MGPGPFDDFLGVAYFGLDVLREIFDCSFGEPDDGEQLVEELFVGLLEEGGLQGERQFLEEFLLLGVVGDLLDVRFLDDVVLDLILELAGHLGLLG